LYVSCIGGSEVQAWDVTTPDKPRLHDTVGGIVQANMMHVTFDGRRLYVTNSAISSIDYSPRYALRLIRIGPDGRMKLDPLFALAVALTATTAPAQQTKPPVVVALVAAMSGGSALSGEAIKRGLTVAIDEINAKGGVLGGRKIELVIRDEEGNPGKGVTAA